MKEIKYNFKANNSGNSIKVKTFMTAGRELYYYLSIVFPNWVAYKNEEDGDYIIKLNNPY